MGWTGGVGCGLGGRVWWVFGGAGGGFVVLRNLMRSWPVDW